MENPDVTLRDARVHLIKAERAKDTDTAFKHSALAAELFAKVDKYMSEGGEPPDAWKVKHG